MRPVSCLVFVFCACLAAGAEPPGEPLCAHFERTTSWLDSYYLAGVDTSSLDVSIEIFGEGNPVRPRIVGIKFRGQHPAGSEVSQSLLDVSFYYHGARLVGMFARGSLVLGVDGSQLADDERRRRRDRAVEAAQRLMGWGPVVSAKPMGEHGEYELVWFGAVGQPPCEHLKAARTAKIDSATGILLRAGII